MKNTPLHLIILGAMAFSLAACSDQIVATLPDTGSLTEEEFANPPMKWRPVPLWFWNDTQVSIEGVNSELPQMIEKDGYGGCAILPFGQRFHPDYLGEDYMAIYARAIEIADSLGIQMSLYDEYGFPSGSMGFSNGDGKPRFKIAHPKHTIKRLDKFETPVACGETVTIDISEFKNTFYYPNPVEEPSERDGIVMAIAAYDAASQSSIDVKKFLDGNIFTWTAPASGDWKVLVFKCFEDGKPRVDYMSKEAVKLFIEDTHEKYYSLFGDKFGTTITSTFFDEPTLYYADGRMWTESFNDEFKARYGMEPDAFYPALWYDLGPQTAAVRNMLYGLHTDLYVEGFTKTVADWAEAHGIVSTGHQDQEEIANTTCVSGDLMLHGKYMTMPGIDKIGGPRPAELYYKVVSSGANNWDKTEVMSETYGAMGNIPVELMYSIAIDQYSKGITYLIPHAVWYDDTNVAFLPELSWRNPLYNEALPGFNKFLSRLRYVLARPGRHVADIAMLYPVQTQYAGHYMGGPLNYYEGGVKVEGTDYPEVSRILTDELGRDFTYVHPSVLDERCSIADGKIRMANKVNNEEFSVLVLPGVKAISLSNMKQVEKAWKSGVKVVFTTQMPSQSAEYGVADEVVASMARRMVERSSGSRSAVFVANPTPEALAAAIDGVAEGSVAGTIAGSQVDVAFLSEGQPFNYLHKVLATDDGECNVYFIGNIDSDARTQLVSLRGEFSSVRLFDPHTGACSPAETSVSNGRTDLTISLDPAKSVLILAKR